MKFLFWRFRNCILFVSWQVWSSNEWYDRKTDFLITRIIIRLCNVSMIKHNVFIFKHENSKTECMSHAEMCNQDCFYLLIFLIWSRSLWLIKNKQCKNSTVWFIANKISIFCTKYLSLHPIKSLLSEKIRYVVIEYEYAKQCISRV